MLLGLAEDIHPGKRSTPPVMRKAHEERFNIRRAVSTPRKMNVVGHKDDDKDAEKKEESGDKKEEKKIKITTIAPKVHSSIIRCPGLQNLSSFSSIA